MPTSSLSDNFSLTFYICVILHNSINTTRHRLLNKVSVMFSSSYRVGHRILRNVLVHEVKVDQWQTYVNTLAGTRTRIWHGSVSSCSFRTKKECFNKSLKHSEKILFLSWLISHMEYHKRTVSAPVKIMHSAGIKYSSKMKNALTFGSYLSSFKI